jgi:ribosome-associated toxin RatA of RatAB toxin-antitoxin module
MHKVEKSVLIRHSADQMYSLVTDVGRYPEFVPGCSGVVIRRNETALMETTINVDFKGIQLTLATRNVQHYPTSIDIQFEEGPFRMFSGSWRFVPLAANGCKVAFELTYDFSNHVLEVLAQPLIAHLVERMTEAFVREAEHIYGSSGQTKIATGGRPGICS